MKIQVRETSIVDRISFLLFFFNIWEEAPAQTPGRAGGEGPSPSPGCRQGEQRQVSHLLEGTVLVHLDGARANEDVSAGERASR